MRRLALVVPVNKEGKVLLQHRTEDAQRKPNCWAFFGGHIDQGEHPRQAVKRECKEELQIDVDTDDFTFFRVYHIRESEVSEMVEKFFYISHIDIDSNVLKGQQLEGDDLGYFKHKDLSKLRITSDDQEVLIDLFMAGLIK